MADIELVIKIPENYYLLHVQNGSIASKIILNAVYNGTPLPKGHGRLIAEPTDGDVAKTIGGQNDFAECIREAVKAVFDNAPTIIPAERSDTE